MDKAFTIHTQTLAMAEQDTVTGTMTTEQTAFVEAATQALQAHTTLTKTQLLEHTGNRKDNKTARSWLDKFEGTHWLSHKTSGVVTYQLLNTPTTATTPQPLQAQL